MILQALNQYYERLLEDSDSGVPEFGFSVESAAFSIVLSSHGEVVQTRDLRTFEGKREILRKVVVPKPPKERSGTRAPAYCCWDKSKYVLGAALSASNEMQFFQFGFDSFEQENLKVLEGVNDVGAFALTNFIHNRKYEFIPEWVNEEILKGRFIVFELDGEKQFIHEREKVVSAWKDSLESSAPEMRGQCLISGGFNEPISETHPQLKRMPGAQSSGAALVSFNFDAAVSHGKKQNLNAPVSERAAFAYTTALNHLLAPGSEHKVQVGDTTVVFWTDAPSGDAVPLFAVAVGGRPAEDTSLAPRLAGHLKQIVKGRLPEELGDPKTRFYVLGLSPNAARISVRFWHVGTVGDMAVNLGEHYRALALKPRFDSEPEHPGPWWLLKELAPQRDSRNMSPLLSGQFLKAILKNQPYPRTLLTAALGRVRADKVVNYLRAAVIKACLVRNEKQEIHMILDKENTDIGYRLGRLFAIVERIQEEAVPGANATVRDRFFSSASATPGRAFPIILRNAQNGLAKIRKGKPGFAVNLEKDIQDIVGGIDVSEGFPASLSLEKQGMFILGYYQQRQDQFTKKEDKTEE